MFDSHTPRSVVSACCAAAVLSAPCAACRFEGSSIGAASPTRPNKVWWSQAEALLGFDWLYRRTSNAAYKEKLQQTLGFIQIHLRDPVYGEWFWQTGPAGGAPLGYNTSDIDFAPTVKGNAWKASYHTGRAMLRLLQAGYVAAGASPEMQRVQDGAGKSAQTEQQGRQQP